MAVQTHRQSQLAQIVNAGGALGLGFGQSQGRKQERGQDRDDRNHHQKFDQGKAHPAPRRSDAKHQHRVSLFIMKTEL